ncbi:ERV/ALR sulfhydryl oxidase domain-containing protein [Aspergillus coremiiformis]|uniref:Sulfhydryl oxidase n=1 Tax=Aspergillus coremiiformis TaxID=138285 RepID=A0A5N6Z0M3_9EURO|nr:ERV/ALR sulfhydryl oxidase domain-containing protein [Aspergillus coremiiformis]
MTPPNPQTNPPTLFPHQQPPTPIPEEPKDKQKNTLILDKDGKPCRLCTSAASWRNLTKQAKATPATTKSTAAVPSSPPSQDDCPPDVEVLGRSTWTFLHSLTASYPVTASREQQGEMRTFLNIFSRLYPCWVCADDFRNWMAEPSGRNEPRLAGRADFGTWMCEAHNEVNRKLGKKEFDCRFWEERWRTGWKDGRCD